MFSSSNNQAFSGSGLMVFDWLSLYLSAIFEQQRSKKLSELRVYACMVVGVCVSVYENRSHWVWVRMFVSFSSFWTTTIRKM